MPTPVLRSHISEYSASAALFQCQHSTHQDGQVFIPNIPDLYFDHTNVAFKISELMRSRNGYTYFFTIPPERNCSGTVVAIQYCYGAGQNRINNEQDVFSFHSVTRDGFVFTVTSSFTVRTTPQESKCTDVEINGQTRYLCCDTTTLSAENQFCISPKSYTFGVTIVNHRVLPITFRNNPEFVVEQYQGSLGITLPAGTSYTLTELTEVNGGLLLMRLLGNNYTPL